MNKNLSLIISLFIGIPLLLLFLFKLVPPATVGVKQNQWGGGIVQEDYPMGFQLGISGYHKWHYLPTRTHFVHFAKDNGGRSFKDEMSWYANPLEVRTKDNNVVSFEITVAYKIIENEAYQIVSDGLKAHYPDRVRSVVTAVLREELPKLTSEDLQLTELRLKRVDETLPILNEQLKEFHCIAESILIRKLQFQTEYETKLQEKQYFRQKALLDEALTLVAEEEKTVNLIERKIRAEELALTQDWQKRIQEKKSEYEVLIAQINADAKVYAMETLARGEAEKVKAEARGAFYLAEADALKKQLRTEALNSKGGSILLALDAADNLNMPEVTLNSDDPSVPLILDLAELTRMLVGVVENNL